MKKFRISESFWLQREDDSADDVLAHVLSFLPEGTEIVEAFAQKVSKTIVYAAVVAMLEDETQAEEIGQELDSTPCPWAHDGLQVVRLW